MKSGIQKVVVIEQVFRERIFPITKVTTSEFDTISKLFDSLGTREKLREASVLPRPIGKFGRTGKGYYLLGSRSNDPTIPNEEI